MKHLVKYLFIGVMAMLIASCGDDKAEGKNSTKSQSSVKTQSSSIDDAQKAIPFEPVGETFVDEKLNELLVICYDARHILSMDELLDYQAQKYGTVLVKFETDNNAKLKKLDKSKKAKYNAALKKMEAYFKQLLLAAHEEDIKKQKEAQKQDSLKQKK